MKKEKEAWLDIKGFKGYYKISNQGRVKSLARTIKRVDGVTVNLKEKILKLYTINEYPCALLCKKGKEKGTYVHDLVSYAFIGPKPKDQEVRHFDGDKGNNFYRNLSYGTGKQNCKDKLRTDSNSYGERRPISKLTFENVGEIRRLKLKTLSNTKISKIFKVSEGTIRHVVNNRTWDPNKYTTYISELKNAGKFKEAKRITEELKLICPEGWLDKHHGSNSSNPSHCSRTR